MKKQITLFFIILMCCALAACMGHNIKLQDVQGMGMSAVKFRYGAPDVVRTEEPNQIWSYGDGECTTLFFFGEDKTVQYIDYAGDC